MTTKSGLHSRDDQDFSVTVSFRAGRLLFALLITDHLGDAPTQLAGVPTKHLQDCIDELVRSLESPDLGYPVDAATGAVGIAPSEVSIHEKLEENQASSSAGVVDRLDAVDRVEQMCQEADETGDVKAQALAIVESWKVLYPTLNTKQELRVAKAKEWVKATRSASTVFGWLSGVEESKLLGLDFPLGYVNKMVVNRAKELAPQQESDGEQEVDDVLDGWRQYAQKFIAQGGNTNGGKNSKGNLQRIVQAVQGSTSQSA